MEELRVSMELITLGARYERARRNVDVDAAIAAETRIEQLAEQFPEVFVPRLVLRGRNAVRRVHGEEELHS